jgi:hypothetical protein
MTATTSTQATSTQATWPAMVPRVQSTAPQTAANGPANLNRLWQPGIVDPVDGHWLDDDLLALLAGGHGKQPPR